jgi:hypothetical protein
VLLESFCSQKRFQLRLNIASPEMSSSKEINWKEKKSLWVKNYPLRKKIEERKIKD